MKDISTISKPNYSQYEFTLKSCILLHATNDLKEDYIHKDGVHKQATKKQIYERVE